jgi:hypothetical protein
MTASLMASNKIERCTIILNLVVCILLRVLDLVQGFPSNATPEPDLVQLSIDCISSETLPEALQARSYWFSLLYYIALEGYTHFYGCSLLAVAVLQTTCYTLSAPPWSSLTQPTPHESFALCSPCTIPFLILLTAQCANRIVVHFSF